VKKYESHVCLIHAQDNLVDVLQQTGPQSRMNLDGSIHHGTADFVEMHDSVSSVSSVVLREMPEGVCDVRHITKKVQPPENSVSSVSSVVKS
jgi:hypothetical protein